MKDQNWINAVARGHMVGLEKAFNLQKKVIVQAIKEESELKMEDVKPSTEPVNGLGVLKVLESTVLREKATAYSPVKQNIAAGGEYIVHQFSDGWYDIGGWIYSKHVNFLPNPAIKMSK